MQYFNVYKEYETTDSANKLMLHAFKEILPRRKNMVGFFVSLILSIIVSSIIAFSENTVELTCKVTNIFLNVQLALFGCIFAVYSLIIGFLNEKILKVLSENVASKKKSLLKMYTDYYSSILFLYFINISFTGITLIICECMTPDFRLTPNILFDSLLALFLLFLYLSFSFRIFYELKSVIYNTIVLFNSTIALNFIQYIEDEEIELETTKEEVASSEEGKGLFSKIKKMLRPK